MTRLEREHRLRTQAWLKDPHRKPYRVSVAAGGMRIARCGELVLGVAASHTEAFAKVDQHIGTPWERAS